MTRPALIEFVPAELFFEQAVENTRTAVLALIEALKASEGVGVNLDRLYVDLVEATVLLEERGALTR